MSTSTSVVIQARRYRAAAGHRESVLLVSLPHAPRFLRRSPPLARQSLPDRARTRFDTIGLEEIHPRLGRGILRHVGGVLAPRGNQLFNADTPMLSS